MRPPRRERSDRSRGRREAERHADPPSAAAEARRQPMGGAGSPPGTLRRTRSRTTVRRPVPRSFGAQAPARAGLHSTGRKEQQRLEEDADGVTALLARRVPLVIGERCERG